MQKLVTMLAVGIIAALVATISPASADDYTAEPTIAFPVYRPATAPAAGDTVIQLEAPGRAWGIRKAARAMDAEIPGLTIRTTGTCTSDPTAVCVRVEIGTYVPERQAAMSGLPGAQWTGLCYCAPTGPRVIYLNRYRQKGWLLGREKKVDSATHEFGHALGLGHHESEGVTSTGNPSVDGQLSAAEVAVLTDWFSTPRYLS